MSETQTLKPESWLWHLLGLINPAIVMASNIVGGFWVASGVIYMLGLGPLLDVFFGRASKPKPPRESGRPFEQLEQHLSQLCALLRVQIVDADHELLLAPRSAHQEALALLLAHDLDHLEAALAQEDQRQQVAQFGQLLGRRVLQSEEQGLHGLDVHARAALANLVPGAPPD